MFEKYRNAQKLNHGWPLPLTCDACGHHGPPTCDGWTPSHAGFGKTAKIFANVACTGCGKELKTEAAGMLRQMFADQPISEKNRRFIRIFLLVMFGVPLVYLGFIALGRHMDWWGAWSFSLFPVIAIIIGPGIWYFNYKIAMIRHECECGSPDYIFLGMLGRAYCLRCDSCGKLLKMRD